jgi:radical SAM protein with 4Fe4S-binding SPASM domain
VIGLTKLVTGRTSPSDRYRYSEKSQLNKRDQVHRFVDKTGFHPVVVWNITQSCNLECAHCYYSAVLGKDPETLSIETIFKIVDDFAKAKVPVVLLSGGEPLLRKDLLEIALYISSKGINPVLSTNGTLIKSVEQAREVKEHGINYVGISIDGLEERHDLQRRKKGSFDRTVHGIKYSIEAGLRISMRFTVTAANIDDLPEVLDLASELKVQRFCMYHLVPSGRGKRYGDISDTQRRELIWSLCDQAKNRDFEILTVDSPADGPLIHQWALENAPELADGILEKLRSQGSDGTGKRIVEIDHNGDVHPNQFWLGKTIGNVVETPFNEIFNPADSGTLDPLLQDLRQEPWSLEGNCATCTYKSLCGGFRARALNMEGSLWASDPTCTLNEIEREALVSV